MVELDFVAFMTKCLTCTAPWADCSAIATWFSLLPDLDPDSELNLPC